MFAHNMEDSAAVHLDESGVETTVSEIFYVEEETTVSRVMAAASHALLRQHSHPFTHPGAW